MRQLSVLNLYRAEQTIERGDGVAINMMCMNTECKYYWEDNCQRNLEEKRIDIDECGKCITFEPGRCEYYKLSEEDNT